MPQISLRNISKSFKVAKRSAGLISSLKSVFKRDYTNIQALNEVSFTIERGELLGYIGPNGAGKSTTIKIMSGILVPSSGECVINGLIPWKNRTAHVRDIGVVFGQKTQLWWDVPVIDSFELLRDIYKVPKKEYVRNKDELIEVLGLSDLINTPVRQLSLGQKMRCELAASLLHSPKILFLDEPTIGLDAVSKLAVRKFIKQINKEKGVTVLLTTHDMGDIEELCSRVMLIGKGSLLYDGDISELRRRFETKRILSIDYENCSTPIVFNQSGVELISQSDDAAVISFNPSEVSASTLINQLSSKYSIKDLTVKESSIEEIISNIYKEYQI
jgi:ABC-2 type transport system ATP-binding protein